MHTLPFSSFLLATLTSGLLLVSGCNRDKDAATPTADLTSAEDSGAGEEQNAYEGDLLAIAAPQDETVAGSPAIGDAASLARVLPACATRTYVAATRTLTIDFGPTNCLCADGRYRRGKIIIAFTGTDLRRHSGAVVTRDNYFVNDNQHLVTRTFTDLGSGSYMVDVQNGQIIFANNGGTHTWSANRICQRTAGYGTPQLSDDEYSITGSASGVNRRSVSYAATITQPLIKRFTAGCERRHFASGIITINNSKEKTLVMNFDPNNTNQCDNLATVTVNGVTKTITLR